MVSIPVVTGAGERLEIDSGAVLMNCDACTVLAARRDLESITFDVSTPRRGYDMMIAYRCVHPTPCLHRARALRVGMWAA